jgi:hypothetical protein
MATHAPEDARPSCLVLDVGKDSGKRPGSQHVAKRREHGHHEPAEYKSRGKLAHEASDLPTSPQ